MQDDAYNYGLGIVRSGSWIVQNPLYSGLGGVMAYLRSEKIAIAIAVTLKPDAFDAEGNYTSPANPMFQQIGKVMAPDDAPPTGPP